MVRPLSLLTALALAAPMPALAQTYPAAAAVVFSVHSVTVQPRTLALNESATAYVRPAQAAPMAVARLQPLTLKARTALDADEAPTVDVRAKDAWFDDQGFRATPTRVSYKARF